MQKNEDDKVVADPSQHSISKSFALHLLPGFVVTVIYIAVAPLAISYGMPLFLVMFLLALFLLIPFELGLLLYLGRKRNGSFSLDGIASYRERMPLRQYFVFTVILLAWALVAAAVLFRPMEKPIIDQFFSWVPPIFLLENFMEHLEEYDRTFLLVTALMGVLLNGFVGPIVEELYFRSYLLPRIPHSTGAWAPLLNSSLFSLYHFFTPWQIPLRILAFTPLFYAVWWKRNVYLGMIVHCAANLIGMSIMLIAVLKALQQQ